MNQPTHIAAVDTAGRFDRREQTDESVDHAEQTPQQTVTPVGTPMSELPASLRLPPMSQYHISTTFHADLLLLDMKPDIILITIDGVLFYAHRFFLLSSSDNTFDGLLGTDTIRTATGTTAASLCVRVPEDSILFNVVLHTIYGMSCRQFKPSLDILLQAVTTLKTYGIDIDQVVEHNTPLYGHIVAETQARPVEVFLVATENTLDTLAVTTSAHLHSLLLPQITDEMAKRMGPRYLKRLLKLHADRLNYLKQLMLDPPKSHPSTVDCGVAEQRELAMAWALAAANLLWKIRPGEFFRMRLRPRVRKNTYFVF
ncbi:hypothetical protein EIP91_010423 [Steccherinum ochraceum]|uniref:BTB domain-containing protein n=1 Tax=Steccherinum ochraceum TaxID=92696 RepID=A0A4R0R8J7_9APHY|nr:hypothetical protein EIP91_010423 [Steccherinum ochraceum]